MTQLRGTGSVMRSLQGHGNEYLHVITSPAEWIANGWYCIYPVSVSVLVFGVGVVSACMTKQW